MAEKLRKSNFLLLTSYFLLPPSGTSAGELRIIVLLTSSPSPSRLGTKLKPIGLNLILSEF
ncbi:hypothetical protein [Calothrix sp. CCY 0018]|uniref:hypothetical protein n=1 Tax=Calothrix sp. CCY 0018 TaxID=3103864 RepID=UPI0039C5B623